MLSPRWFTFSAHPVPCVPPPIPPRLKGAGELNSVQWKGLGVGQVGGRSRGLRHRIPKNTFKLKYSY